MKSFAGHPFRQVLVPIDGSPGIERLVRAAATTAGRLDAGLLLWGVLRPGADRRALEHHLYGLLQSCADGHGAFMAVASHDPVGALLDHTEQVSGSLVCVVSHGRGRIGEESMGCITDEWLRRAHAPTLVIGPRVDLDHATATSWQELVACVDASDRGERALPTAAGFARATGLHLTVMQAVSADDDVFDGERSRRYVEALAGSLSPAADARVLGATDRPARALCLAADTMPGAILAVASHGRGGGALPGESDSPLGSVTNELIRNSLGPVLVIPERGELVGAGSPADRARW